jgi:hypothetical protein
VAAVLGHQLADERRLPDRFEAVAGAQHGEATEVGIDENEPLVLVENHVVHVQIPRGVGEAGHVEAVVAVVLLPRREAVFDLPDLVTAVHVEGVAVEAQPHGFVEETLVDGEAATLLAAEQEQAVALVGGEGNADPLLVQPVPQAFGARHGGGRFMDAIHIVADHTQGADLDDSEWGTRHSWVSMVLMIWCFPRSI